MTGKVRLGTTQIEIPPIGAGVMVWGGGFPKPYGPPPSQHDVAAAADTLIAADVAFFDTAEMYGFGASERTLAATLGGRAAVIATKFMPRPWRGSGALPPALEGSLARLRRPVVDLYYIHARPAWIRNERLMGRLAGAVAAGKVRAAGVSNYTAAHLRMAHAALARHGVPLAATQMEYSLLNRQVETDGVLDACRELGITLVAYMPLASGALTGKYLEGPPPTGFRPRMSYFKRDTRERLRPVIDLLRRIGERHGATPSQIALRWLVDRGVVPIPGVKNERQAAEASGVLRVSMTADESAELDHATAAWRTRT